MSIVHFNCAFQQISNTCVCVCVCFLTLCGFFQRDSIYNNLFCDVLFICWSMRIIMAFDSFISLSSDTLFINAHLKIGSAQRALRGRFVDKAIILTRTKDENNNTTYTTKCVSARKKTHENHKNLLYAKERTHKRPSIDRMNGIERKNKINGNRFTVCRIQACTFRRYGSKYLFNIYMHACVHNTI